MWRRLAAGGHDAEHSHRFESGISFVSSHSDLFSVDALLCRCRIDGPSQDLDA
jgi:hypothetical protein